MTHLKYPKYNSSAFHQITKWCVLKIQPLSISMVVLFVLVSDIHCPIVLSMILLTQARMSLDSWTTWASAGSCWAGCWPALPSPFPSSSFLGILPQTCSGARGCCEPKAGPQFRSSYKWCQLINPACLDPSVKPSYYQDLCGVRFLFWFSEPRDNVFQKINGKKKPFFSKDDLKSKKKFSEINLI